MLVVLTLLLVDVFDTAGTLVGVATRGKMMDGHRLPRLARLGRLRCTGRPIRYFQRRRL